MSSNTPDVLQNRVWIDYDQPLLLRPRVLVLEWWAFFWVSAFAIWVTIWGGKFWKSIVNKEDGILAKFGKSREPPDRPASQHSVANLATEPIPLNAVHFRHGDEETHPQQTTSSQQLEDPVDFVLDTTAPESAIWAILCEIWRVLKESGIRLSGGTAREPYSEILKRSWRNILNNIEYVIPLSLWLLFAASIFMGLAIGGTTVSYLQSDSLALTTSPTCGFWVIPENTRRMVYAWNQAEEQAANYYRDCYEAAPSIQQCNIFAHNEQLSNTTDNDDCPFLGNVCLLGPNSAVTFDTGYVDTSTLGINSARRPYYRRKTTCAPLVTEGYVDVWDHYSGFLIQAQFYYGPDNTSLTYNQSRIFFLPGTSSPTYEVAAKKAGKDFVPFPEFNARDGGHTVLLFFTSFNINLPNRSDDPIFPARLHVDPPLTGDPNIDGLQNYWSNDEKHSGVLGCAEYAWLCKTASNESCFDPWDSNHIPDDIDDITYATGISLMHSGFWSGLPTRTSKELDATRKIIDISVSLPLAAEQWKVEAKRMFEMFIIRTKLEVLELARGTRASMSNFTNRMPQQYKSICGKVKFQSVGYRNLSLVGMLVATLGPPVFVIPIRKKPAFYWVLYVVWGFATLFVKEKSVFHWIWMAMTAVGGAIESGVATLGVFIQEHPKLKNFCRKTPELIWACIKGLGNGLWYTLKLLNGFLGGVLTGHREGRRTWNEFVERFRSETRRRREAISMDYE